MGATLYADRSQKANSLGYRYIEPPIPCHMIVTVASHVCKQVRLYRLAYFCKKPDAPSPTPSLIILDSQSLTYSCSQNLQSSVTCVVQQETILDNFNSQWVFLRQLQCPPYSFCLIYSAILGLFSNVSLNLTSESGKTG